MMRYRDIKYILGEDTRASQENKISEMNLLLSFSKVMLGLNRPEKKSYLKINLKMVNFGEKEKVPLRDFVLRGRPT